MKRSTERILTTHTGSLGRSPELHEMLVTISEGNAVDTSAFQDAVQDAVNHVVRQQASVGLDVVNDGEQSKTGFAAYVSDRLDGFGGPRHRRPDSSDARQFPDSEYAEKRGTGMTRPACDGPVRWKDFSVVEQDIARLKTALDGVEVEEAFMSAASPGTIANHHPNEFYGSREEYLSAIATTMRREYTAIVEAGFILQLDCPDLALKHLWFPDHSLEEFRKEVALHVEALNESVKDLPADRVRMHVCWGAGEGPHNHDVELKDIVDLLLKATPTALSIVGANGRHEHEWQVWKTVKLPDDKVLIPGVVDNTTNIIEHPETVAERLERYAGVLGKERIIAGVDCGFGTTVSRNKPPVDPLIAWEKLRSLADGARLASAALWG